MNQGVPRAQRVQRIDDGGLEGQEPILHLLYHTLLTAARTPQHSRRQRACAASPRHAAPLPYCPAPGTVAPSGRLSFSLPLSAACPRDDGISSIAHPHSLTSDRAPKNDKLARAAWRGSSTAFIPARHALCPAGARSAKDPCRSGARERDAVRTGTTCPQWWAVV